MLYCLISVFALMVAESQGDSRPKIQHVGAIRDCVPFTSIAYKLRTLVLS